MQIEYKRDLQNNYMILEAEAYADESEYMLKMAEQNEISGLLSFHSGKKDGKLFLHYEITSRQSIETLYERNRLSSRDILFLLNGISQILEELQKYLLNPDYLLFHPQFIFMYPDKSKIFLCYLPGEKNYPITELAEFILKRLNHEDAQAVTLGYRFYKQTLEENFSLQLTLKEILLEQGEILYKDWESEKIWDEASNAERKWNTGIEISLGRDRNKKGWKREQWNEEDDRAETGYGDRKGRKIGSWTEADEEEVGYGNKKGRKIGSWREEDDRAEVGYGGRKERKAGGWNRQDGRTEAGHGDRKGRKTGSWREEDEEEVGYGSRKGRKIGSWTEEDEEEVGYGSRKERKIGSWREEDEEEVGYGSRKERKIGSWTEKDNRAEAGYGEGKDRKIGGSWSRKKERGCNSAVENSARYDWENAEYSNVEKNSAEDELYEVTHKVRKRKSKYKTAADWLFERVHIGVIVSTLLLVAVVELVFFLNWISLTEAGGIFFFIISIEILINKFWRNRKEQKHADWWQESEEEYRNLRENMYQDELAQEMAWQENISAPNMESAVESEETRCLIQEDDMSGQGIRLVCLNHANIQMNEMERYPDMIIGKETVYVGKSGKDVDIVLNSDTISRIHAKLEVSDQKYYVRDLNSKNGTFVNGKRLLPQEQCEISEGDRIAFADILYHVVQL